MIQDRPEGDSFLSQFQLILLGKEVKNGSFSGEFIFLVDYSVSPFFSFLINFFFEYSYFALFC